MSFANLRFAMLVMTWRHSSVLHALYLQYVGAVQDRTSHYRSWSERSDRERMH